MLALLLQNFQLAAMRTARTAALGFVAVAALLAGCFFLTLALWIVLATLAGPLVAAIVLACLYLGIALLLFALMSARARARARARTVTMAAAAPAAVATGVAGGSLTQLLLAFIVGLTAARKSRS